MKNLIALGLLCLLGTLPADPRGADSAAGSSSHPAEVFGPALSPIKIAGVGPCMAVEVSGERHFAIGRGKFHVLEPGEMRDVGQLPAFGIDGLHLGGRPSAKGDRLALVRRQQRLVQVLDISDITRPILSREFQLRGHPGACAFWMARVLIPAGYQGLLLEKK